MIIILISMQAGAREREHKTSSAYWTPYHTLMFEVENKPCCNIVLLWRPSLHDAISYAYVG